jgi:hypothetical protein
LTILFADIPVFGGIVAKRVGGVGSVGRSKRTDLKTAELGLVTISQSPEMARAPTATGSAVAQQPVGAGKKKKGDKQQTEGGPKGELSKAQKKKAAKKAKKAAHASWCWYCDREFQDDKVLLSHQKSKHFRCPHCPRRLNTAGGLAVHIDQVHKVPTDRCVLLLAVVVSY